MMRILSVFLCSFLFNLVYGQNEQDSLIGQTLDPVVVSAQYVPRAEKNSVYKLKTITNKTINQKSASNLKDLLQHELMIDLNQQSVFGASIEMQGLSKENIKILIDGIPVVGRLNGVIDLGQINLSNIDHVEIIEGPVSIFYGTDATGGIINLISKSNQKKDFVASANLYYESIQATDLSANIGWKFGGNLLKFDGGTYNFNGLSTNDAIRNFNWEQKKQYHAEMLFARKIKNLELKFNSKISQEKLFSKGDLIRKKIKDKDYFTRRIDNVLSLSGKVLEHHFFDMSISYLDYQRYHTTYQVDTSSFVAVKTEGDQKEDNIVKYNFGGLKAQLGKGRMNSILNYAVGFDGAYEQTSSERIKDTIQHLTTLAVYASLNVKMLDKIELQPALRYTYNSNFGALISPAFNSVFHLGNNQKFRFSYARGFRAPSLKEIYLDFHIAQGPITFIISGNENLKVEESHSFNLNYTYTGNSFVLSPKLFYNDISNLIALSQLVDFKRHYINIDKFKSVGGGLDFSWQPLDILDVKFGFSYIGRYNKFTEDFDEQEFLFAPEFSTGISYALPSDFSFNLFYKYSGERAGFVFDKSNNQVNKTLRTGFSNLDISISKSFFNEMLSISLGGKNLFDVTDIEIINEAGQAHSRDMQLWGRSFFVKTKFSIF